MAGTPRGAGILGKEKDPETIRALVYGGAATTTPQRGRGCIPG